MTDHMNTITDHLTEIEDRHGDADTYHNSRAVLNAAESLDAERDAWKQRASERREGYMKVLSERDALLAYARAADEEMDRLAQLAGFSPAIRRETRADLHAEHNVAHLFDQQ